MTQTPDSDKLEILVLARLCTRAKKPPSPGDIARSLRPYLDHALTDAEQRSLVEQTLAALGQRGQVTTRPTALTGAGRARVRRAFALDRDPEWKVLRDRHLVASALGVAVTDKVKKRLSEADGLRGCVLRARHDLATKDPTPTLNQAVDALVWRHLGVDTQEPLTLNKLRQHVLAQTLGVERRMSKDKLAHMLAARATGAGRTDAASLRAALVRAWMFAEPAEPAPARTEPARAEPAGAQQLDLASFARQVNRAAQEETEGRFGERRVFISAVWRRLAGQPGFAGMTEAGFKERLVEANRSDLVKLHRADLVAAMPAGEVAASTTQYLNATFHLIEPPPRSPS